MVHRATRGVLDPACVSKSENDSAAWKKPLARRAAPREEVCGFVGDTLAQAAYAELLPTTHIRADDVGRA